MKSSVQWRKSSYSGTGNCIEVACIHSAPWRKSSRSGGNGNCVEVAPVATTVAVRDSKLPTSGDFPHLLLDTDTWTGLIAAIKTGDIA
ncbi:MULTISPECIES: DUF397 domain-containing protein [Glycomyces]|jgi:hypothetical protein|uniref:DUF397 domain-containing protein n=2 Tax=Glycomyces TaxID=58113 RepID=A0A9X3PNA8_9ACTN|nr:DUF397 domain-containing protein [Glycomyces lechevalierae]MDA1387170.1 DUF397 domain-containing protein [Glycomyces lechevalierae]